jgi:hypothetical protein
LLVDSTLLGLRAGRDAGVARHFHDISERMAAETVWILNPSRGFLTSVADLVNDALNRDPCLSNGLLRFAFAGRRASVRI